MSDDQVTLTRKQLYELAWSEPMIKLANRFGLSDVGLKKICRKYNIPVPPRGYWARKQAGQNPGKTPLPKGVPLDTLIKIFRNPMHGNPSRLRENRIQTKEIAQQIALNARSKIPHPLIERARKILQARTPNRDAILEPTNAFCLDVKVSSESLDRALSILDSIIKALEKLGHEVLITEEATSALISGFQVRFSLTEELRRRYIEPREHYLEGHYRFGHSLFSENRTPTGNLCLTIYPAFLTNSRKIRKLKNWRSV
jgi:hypothetical protein